MSEYKNSILRELGIRNPKKKILEMHDDEFPGIDPMNNNGDMEEPMDQPSSRDRMVSPTAVSTPVLAIAVRGSSTGGLPSGKNIDSSKLGGYEPIPTADQNSLVVDKTPKNRFIENPSPVAHNAEAPITPAEEHPHQTQNTSDQPPQAVTGASEEDSSMQLKASLPKGIDVDVAESEDEDNNANNPEFQEKDRNQFRKDRSASSEGDEVRKELDINESKELSTQNLLKVKRVLQEKAIKGTMNKKETEVFRCITEVLQKRGQGLEKRMFGKKNILETASVISEELSPEEIAQTWEDDKDGEYVAVVPDKNVAYYVAHGTKSEDISPVYGNIWTGIKTWMDKNQFYPNIWSSNERGNMTLHNKNGKYLGGLV